MQIASLYSEPIHLRLNSLDIQVLQITLLGRNNSRQTKVATECFTQLLEQSKLTICVAESTAVGRPVPIDIDSAEVPLGEELLE